MMRLKPSLKNSARPVLLSSLSLSLIIFLSNCAGPIEPTYKEKDIPYLVKKICKEEYSLDVTTQRTHTTLWIYAPLSKILNENYGAQGDKVFDEEMAEKLRNILTTIGRVLISSDNTPEFFALLASDINIGLDYTIIGCVLDTKKSYAGFVPWTEINRRYVIRFKISTEAIGDASGSHFIASDINLPDFLVEQIAQRIAAQFQEENLKNYFKVTESKGKFSNNTFAFEYSIEQILKPEKEIDVRKEILKIVTYCIQTYDFKDFSAVEITDLITQDKLVLSKAALWARPKE